MIIITFLRYFLVVLKYSHSQIADDHGLSSCTKQATLMLCKNMQLFLARFPQCKPRCISSNINENLFSRGFHIYRMIFIKILAVDMLIFSSTKATAVYSAGVGAVVRQPAARERAEGGGSR